MNLKERETGIRHAKRLLKRQQAAISSRKGARVHDGAMADRVARLRALEIDTCGGCQGLKIEGEPLGSLINVRLRCRFGGSPLELHRLEVTELGEVPECEFRIPFEE